HALLILATLERALGRLGPLGQTRIDRCAVEVGHSDRGRTTAPRANATERDVDADAIEPGRESRVAAKPLEAAERDHEDFLDEIVEVGTIAEDAVEVAGDLSAEAVIELVLRSAVIAPAAL